MAKTVTTALAHDLIVFSHLRWDFVFQRPQHLLTRFARHNRVFYVEEPVIGGSDLTMLDIQIRQNGVRVVTPRLPRGLDEESTHRLQRELVDQLLRDHAVQDYLLWYYTPMALPFTLHLKPRAVVYDCMDELSLFKGAHGSMIQNETQLLTAADVVFTGGHHLYEHKSRFHSNVHPFPSSIDFHHFAEARDAAGRPEPSDQAGIPHPRIGFFGVLDERLDLELIDGVAAARPDWHFVFLGPVVKISPDSLPRRPNLHYLGQKNYADLPAYIASWEVAILPFARNDSTRFISPTKTPEYLAAGRPVVSTSIRDVVRPYGEQGMVRIADTVQDFTRAIEESIDLARKDPSWRLRVDEYLSQLSWDKTWEEMVQQIVRVSSPASAPAESILQAS